MKKEIEFKNDQMTVQGLCIPLLTKEKLGKSIFVQNDVSEN
jgi:hypothetical protein